MDMTVDTETIKAVMTALILALVTITAVVSMDPVVNSRTVAVMVIIIILVMIGAEVLTAG